MDAAARAEPVLDDVLVERVRAQGRLRRRDPQLATRHEPQQRAFALADRAVAGERAVDHALDLERHAAAMAATVVFHASLLRPRSVTAVSFAGLDREAALLARQPFHSRRVAVRGPQHFTRPVPAKLDAVIDARAVEGSRAIEVLHGDLIGAVGAGDLEIGALG